MATKRIDIVLVKLGAAIVVVIAFRSLSNYLAYFAAPSMAFISIGAFVLTFVVPISIACVLWFFPATVVGQVSETDLLTEHPTYSPRSILIVGITLIGLYLFVVGLLDTIFYEVLWYTERNRAEIAYPVTPNEVATRISNIIQIIVGLALVIGRQGFAHLFYKIRYAGTDTS